MKTWPTWTFALGATLKFYRGRLQARCSNPRMPSIPSNDDFDFPPTAHPVREFVTASIFVLAVIVLMVWCIVWCGWKLL
jgi:hypothetical protein